jgi:site-specific DNA recombinase
MTQTKSPFPRSSSVAAYLRDSGGDDQDLSVGQQERSIRDWCNKNDIELTQIFRDEARPGSSTIGRNGFDEMIAYFRAAKKVREAGLVIWSFARFSRSQDDSQYFKADLRRRGYIIHSMTDSLPEGTMGKFFEAAVEWKNADFLETLSRETKRGQQDLVKEHKALGGTPPAGFRRVQVTLGKRRDGSAHIVHRWDIDPETIDRVRLAWEMKAGGASYKQIHAATHIYNSVNSYVTFFRNRLYLGEMKFGETIIPNYVEPVIDQDTWDAVHARMQNGRGHIQPEMDPLDNPRRAYSRFLLSGLLCCQECGAPMNGISIPSKTGPSHEYYECSRAKRSAGCQARPVPKMTIEKAVLDEFREYLVTPEVMAAVRQRAKERSEEVTNETSEKIAQANQRLGSVHQRITNIVNAIETTPDSEFLAKRLLDLEQEERDIRRQVKTLEEDKRATRHAVDIEMLSKVRGLVENIENIHPDDLKSILIGSISKVLGSRKDRTVYGEVLFLPAPELVFADNEFL